MTKSLTEQWHDGTLPRGGYYIKLLDGSIKQTDYDNISKTFDTEFFRYNVSVKEVLAPVPSYDRFSRLLKKVKKLEGQLKSARNVIKKYGGVGTIGVKDKNGKLRICRPADQYLKKWGLK